MTKKPKTKAKKLGAKKKKKKKSSTPQQKTEGEPDEINSDELAGETSYLTEPPEPISVESNSGISTSNLTDETSALHESAEIPSGKSVSN